MQNRCAGALDPAVWENNLFTRMTMNQMPQVRRRRSAFTLLEMLLVIALLGLLATVAVVQFNKVDDNARMDIASTWVRTSATAALMSFKQHIGTYPTTEQGLRALITAPENTSGRWRGPYFQGRDVPLDPWKKPYQYRYPGTKNVGSYDLYSWGPDQVESADDIGNWD
jgi:general secretion pathway protein G